MKPTTKSFNPVLLLGGKLVSPILEVYLQANHLKNIYRFGWIKKGRDLPIRFCESDADHCFLLALLAIFVCDSFFPTLDRHKVLIMCLVHELGEIINGDPRSPLNETERLNKYEKEKSAIIEVFAHFPPGATYLALWEEFEKGITPEAKLVRELDKLEMAFQSKVYSLQHGKNLQEFIDDVRTKIHTPELLQLLAEVECL